MEKEVVAALIVAVTSLLVAFFSLYVSRDSLKIQENAKRIEQLRVKKIEVRDSLIRYLSDYLMGVEGVLFIVKNNPKGYGISESEVVSLMKPILAASANLRETVLSSEAYLTPDIFAEIEAMTNESNCKLFCNENDLMKKINDIRETHSRVVKLFYKTDFC